MRETFESFRFYNCVQNGLEVSGSIGAQGATLIYLFVMLSYELLKIWACEMINDADNG